jgi:hypothetical protein
VVDEEGCEGRAYSGKVGSVVSYGVSKKYVNSSRMYDTVDVSAPESIDRVSESFVKGPAYNT